MKELKKRGAPLVIGFLLILFVGVSTWLYASITQMHGNARVVNYVGIVRGATQKLIKEELYGYPDNALIGRLDSIVLELLTGEGPNGLIVLQDDAYLDHMERVAEFWADIKGEILHIRAGSDTQRLFDISQEYFILVDQTVSCAEEYSETLVSRVNVLLSVINCLFVAILIAIVFFYLQALYIQNDLLTAQASSRAKGDFLSRMSHEIRTPLNAIIGMTAIAQKTDEMPKMHYCLGKVEDASKQLLDIINDILDMSKIEADQLEITPHAFDFDQALQGIFSVIQVKAGEKRQSLRFLCDQVFTRDMVCDELRLTQVLVNLLNNAVKFSPEDGEITLQITQLEETPDSAKLRFTVADNGIGVTEIQKNRLFNSFEQADSSITRKYGGTGLGLSICKRIIELMGGKIWVESEPGRGSRFIFDLHVLWGEERFHEMAGRLDSSMRILFADPDPALLDYTQRVLERFALSCDTAPDARRSLDLVDAAVSAGRPYQIVFLDWALSCNDGHSLISSLRAALDGDAAIVVTSSGNWEAIHQELPALEISNFLSKPLLPSALLKQIARMTEKCREAEKTCGADAQEWAGRRILLVEDIEINQEIILAMLEDTGIVIDTANNGQEAVDMFRNDSELYSVILMDMQMPVLDGLSAARVIRSLSLANATTVPIIALTANAFKDDIDQCLEAGMNGHIPKPVDMGLLLDTLGMYL